MAYATVQQVKSLCPHLFNITDLKPEDSEVEEWLAEGAAHIDAYLRSKGYSTPVGSTADAYPLLTDLNRFWAAAMAEYSRLTSSSSEGNTRAEIFEQRFDDRLKRLLSMDLSALGMTQTAKYYVGGISESEKESVEGDSDRIMGAFRRGMHAIPGGGTTSSRVPSDPQERSD